MVLQINILVIIKFKNFSLIPEKKSQSALKSSFMSAMNGASRLRYGKRANLKLSYQLDPQLIDYKEPSR